MGIYNCGNLFFGLKNRKNSKNPKNPQKNIILNFETLQSKFDCQNGV
jgi:hypothetical protein